MSNSNVGNNPWDPRTGVIYVAVSEDKGAKVFCEYVKAVEWIEQDTVSFQGKIHEIPSIIRFDSKDNLNANN